MNVFKSVERFASVLGWHGIVESSIRLTDSNCGRFDPGTEVTCWSTTDLGFFIQINQSVPGQFNRYRASVAAHRYGIAPIPFQECEFTTPVEAQREGVRLSQILSRAQFKRSEWRRTFLTANPGVLLRSTKKWRGWRARLLAEI